MLSAIGMSAAEYRKLDGKIWEAVASDAWVRVNGEVLQVLPSGVLAQVVTRKDIYRQADVNSLTAQGQFGGGRNVLRERVRTDVTRGKRFYVANAPASVRVEGAVLSLIVYPRPPENVNGSVIESYDFGTVATPAEVAQEMKRRQDAAQARYTSAVAAEQQRANAHLPRVIAYQLTQASNGLPSFQFEMGRRYLKGDGVETNALLARHWLHAAATNGLESASNLLSSLKPH